MVEHTDFVRSLYDAFGRGDRKFILISIMAQLARTRFAPPGFAEFLV